MLDDEFCTPQYFDAQTHEFLKNLIGFASRKRQIYKRCDISRIKNHFLLLTQAVLGFLHNRKHTYTKKHNFKQKIKTICFKK